jgi:hypothetical protein
LGVTPTSDEAIRFSDRTPKDDSTRRSGTARAQAHRHDRAEQHLGKDRDRWLGLTATPYRRDKLDDLIGMYLGPVRHVIKIPREPTSGMTALCQRSGCARWT